jgi:hypothetical protein
MHVGPANRHHDHFRSAYMTPLDLSAVESWMPGPNGVAMCFWAKARLMYSFCSCYEHLDCGDLLLTGSLNESAPIVGFRGARIAYRQLCISAPMFSFALHVGVRMIEPEEIFTLGVLTIILSHFASSSRLSSDESLAGIRRTPCVANISTWRAAYVVQL